MKNVTLHIKTYDGERAVALEEETSFGRTDAARVVLGDSGLSRLNTSFFRDEDLVFVVDENSTNGTFVNGTKISGAPRQIFDGDQIKIGSETRIRVEIREAGAGRQPSTVSEPPTETKTPPAERPAPKAETPKPAAQTSKSDNSQMLILAAVGSTLLILFLAIAGFLIVNSMEGGSGGTSKKPNPKQKIIASAPIPIRVVDPLGGGEIESLDDLMEAWEVQDAEFEAKDLQAVTTSTDAPQLTVSVADWETARNSAMGKRNAPVGLVSGVQIPPELIVGGITKQLAKFKELGITPDKLPKDFAALARLRAANQLVELPLATKFYYLDNIGTSADGSPFDSFEPTARIKSPLIGNSEDFKIIQTLAANYNGQKYNLDDPASRLQMKRRLLRMFHPRAKAFLEEFGAAYQAKFNRPLKVTSLTRSLEYQFDLSKDTRNAYRGTTPPHSTGATFDMAYMHMTAEEQTFIMAKLAEYERAGKIDALREVAQTPCIHIFVFP